MKTKYLIRILITSLLFSAILFLSAGKVNYLQGWIFLVTTLITSLMNFWTIRNDAALMNERSKVGEGAKSWDKILLGLSAFVYLANIIIAGLDSGRYKWSPNFHWSVYATAAILSIAGNTLFLAARKENRFFSSVVRIQAEHEHTVCDTGVYRTVRHPGYSGMTISLVAIPLLLGSVWSIIPTAIAILLLFLRTYWEDETLKKELPGYAEFAQRTKHRLIPLLW